MTDFYDDPSFDADGPPAVPLYKVRDLGDTLGDTFALFRQTWREYGWGIIVLVAPLAVLNLMLSIASGAQAQSTAMLTNWSEIFSGQADPALMEGPPLGYVFLSSLLGLLIVVMVQAATLGYVRLYRNGQAGAVTPGVLWEETKPVFLPVLGVGVLSFVVLTLLVLLNIVPCLGQIAFLAGFLFLLPVLWMWPVARIFDSGGLGAAFTRVRTLMKGHWGPSVLAVLLVGLVVVMLATAVSLPFVILLFALGGLFGGVLTVVGTAAGILLYPVYGLPTLAAALHYFNLVERSDSVDLARRVDDLDDLDPPAEPAAW